MAQTYNEMRHEVVQFINNSSMCAYDVARICHDLCTCRTCKFFTQHYTKDGQPVDFGHCHKNNQPRSRKPNMQSCGFWTLDGEELT